MKKFVRNNIPAIVSIVFTVFILVAAFIWFRFNIHTMVNDTNETFMTENASATADVFYTKLVDQSIMLESQTRYFYDIDMADYNSMKNAILSTRGIGSFKTIGVANASGTTLNYNGKSSGNILFTDYFQAALKGESSISGSTSIDEDGDEVLVLSVPILQNGESVGAVFGTFTKSILSELMGSGTYSGRAYDILMSADGDILAVAANADAYWKTVDNFFLANTDIEGAEKTKMLQAIEGEKPVVFEFSLLRKEMSAVMTPVGIHDWFFVSIIPDSVIQEQSAKVTLFFSIVVVAVTLAFVLTIISILYLAQRNNMIQKSNERYRVITSQTRAIVFEVDFQKHKIEVSGNVEYMFNDESEFESKDIKMLLKRIHPDDAIVAQNMESAVMGTSGNFTGEGRFLCADGEYYWFRIIATILRDENGTALNMIGNMLNVEEQRREEFLLKQKAEIDPLTGILNKGALEKHISETLDEATNEDLLALYIIDLDCFKQVNDTLGHAVGDRVLSDVAKKLCTVFSDKDTVGRIGGDEFSVFLKLTPEGRRVGMRIIESRARAIVSALRESYSNGKDEVTVSASVGIAMFPVNGDTYSELYRKADAALYAAKHSGKNQYFVFNQQ